MKKREPGGNASLASKLGGNAIYNLIRPAVLPAEQPQEQNRQVVAPTAAPSTTTVTPITDTSAIAPTAQETKTKTKIQQPVNGQQAFPPALHVPLSPEQAKLIKLRSKL